MQFKNFLIIIIYILDLKAMAVNLNDIKVVTENTPPYIFYNEKNIADGSVVKSVRAVFKNLSINPIIEILPWAQAYNQAIKKPNVMIFPIAWTKERSKIFKYAGVVQNLQSYVYKKKGKKILLNSNINDVLGLPLCAIRDDITSHYAKKRGFKIIHETAYGENALKMLFGERCDIFISNDPVNDGYIKILNDPKIKKDSFEKVMKADEIDSKRYMAFSVSTQDEIVEAFMKASAHIVYPDN